MHIYFPPDPLLIKHIRFSQVFIGDHSSVNRPFNIISPVPNSGFLSGLADLDEGGYILQLPGKTATKTPGLYAAGDVADHYYRQAITAAGQGCAAALEAERYLADQED